MIKTQTQHNRNIEKLTLKKLMPIFKKLRASSVRALIVQFAHVESMSCDHETCSPNDPQMNAL